MFLTKDDFLTALDILQSYDDITMESEINSSILEKYARQLFEDYDSMIDDSKEQIIEMLRQDITIKLYSLN